MHVLLFVILFPTLVSSFPISGQLTLLLSSLGLKYGMRHAIEGCIAIMMSKSCMHRNLFRQNILRLLYRFTSHSIMKSYSNDKRKLRWDAKCKPLLLNIFDHIAVGSPPISVSEMLDFDSDSHQLNWFLKQQGRRRRQCSCSHPVRPLRHFQSWGSTLVRLFLP